MKLFITAFITLLATTALSKSLHPWKDLVGCYVTKERNGQIIHPSDYNETRITEGEDGFLTKLDGSSINTLEMVVFQGCSSEWCYYDYISAFKNLGNYSRSKNLGMFSFKGYLIYVYEASKVKFRMSSVITYKKVSDKLILLKNKKVVYSYPEFNADDEYLLEKTDCNPAP